MDLNIAAKSGKAPTALSIVSAIYAAYGMRGLFAGVVPRLMKIVPGCAITISAIEYSKKMLRNAAISKERERRLNEQQDQSKRK